MNCSLRVQLDLWLGSDRFGPVHEWVAVYCVRIFGCVEGKFPVEEQITIPDVVVLVL